MSGAHRRIKKHPGSYEALKAPPPSRRQVVRHPVKKAAKRGHTMADEPQDVVVAEPETAPDSSTADQQPEEPESVPKGSDEEAAEEPVDEMGVPIKNRIAEARRKGRKEALSSMQAQAALLSGDVPGSNQVPSEDEAIETVRRLAREEQLKTLEPVLAKQFLLENPEARDPEVIEQMNKVRKLHPELASVDKLDTVYKIVRADLLEDRLRREEEAKAKVKAEKQVQATQAAVEGTGTTTTPPTTLVDQINQASLEDLTKLEAQIQGK